MHVVCVYVCLSGYILRAHALSFSARCARSLLNQRLTHTHSGSALCAEAEAVAEAKAGALNVIIFANEF